MAIEWSPKAVFRVVSLVDVLSVETKLESSNDISGSDGEEIIM